MTGTRPTRMELGTQGEELALEHLQRAGMELLDRNWRCRAGEIDLVMRDGGQVVVCEVKTRTSTRFGDPVEAVTPTKHARLRRLAGLWVAEHASPGGGLRLDVVGLLFHPDGTHSVDHRRGV